MWLVTIFSHFAHSMLPYYGAYSGDDFICSKAGGMKQCPDAVPAYQRGSVVCAREADLDNPWNNAPQNDSCVNWNQYYSICEPYGNNSFKGSISFDNIGMAWVAIFQVISLEGWVDIMYYIQDAHSFWNWIYFVVLIVVGFLYVLNNFICMCQIILFLWKTILFLWLT